MNPRPAEKSTVSLADLADVLLAIAGIVLVLAGLTVAVAFCSVLIADLIGRMQVIEARAVELVALKLGILQALLP